MRPLSRAIGVVLLVLTCMPAAAAVAVSGSTSGSTSSSSTADPGSCATPSTTSGIRCDGIWRATSARSATPRGLSATQIESIYHVPHATTAGTGPLVAVIDLYHYSAVAGDLAAYRRAEGLPACTVAGTVPCFREVDEHGGNHFMPEPLRDDWSGETALDLQMVSAACPTCRILLVSASGQRALTTAIQQAVAQGAQYVSMSFSGPARHDDSAFFERWPDVLFTAASGDDGYQGADWPNEAEHVLAIGGVKDSGGALTVWKDSYGGTGSGCARRDHRGVTPRMPTQQRVEAGAWKTCGDGKKAETDLSAIADPGTGVATYIQGKWYEAGGTSVASPIIASLYADAGNHTDPYAAYVNGGIADVTHGSTCTHGVSGRICKAARGWDGPTGIGMPTSPAALAVAPPPPTLARVAGVRGRTGRHLRTRIALPTSTRARDGSTAPLSDVSAVVRGLPDGLSARVHGHTLILSGTSRKVARGHAQLYVWGRTTGGRRTEAAATTITWRIARRSA